MTVDSEVLEKFLSGGVDANALHKPKEIFWSWLEDS